MQRMGVFLLIVIAGSAAACQSADAPIRDPIPDIPPSQQRALARTDFDWKWPFSIGHGTLGCIDAAIIFRYDGVRCTERERASSR
jgi:hypothetical protein